MDFRKLNNISDDKSLPNNQFQYPGNTEDHAFNEMLPHLATLDVVYFAGGEPLMQIQHFQTLQKLVDFKNTSCYVLYNTNLSRLTLQNYDAIDYWKKFDNVRIMASIDGSYERAEYWRKGTVWSDIVSNVIKIKKEVPNLKFGIAYTLSWPNAIDLIRLHKEWIELDIIKPEDITINLLQGPYYCLKNIPKWKKQQIEKIYIDHIEWLQQFKSEYFEFNKMITLFHNAIAFMNTEVLDLELEKSLKEFFYLTIKLDNIRNENFFEVFTEHKDLKSWMSKQGIIGITSK